MRPTLLAMGALLLGLSATPSSAAPAAGLPDLGPDSGLELVAGGCGPRLAVTARLEQRFDAYERDERVFAHSWRLTIPRDHL